VGVLDGEVVEPELLLDLAQQLLARLVQADPDELALDLQDLADVRDRDVGHLAAVGVRGAVDDLALGLRLRRGDAAPSSTRIANVHGAAES
jgi:hypothetical protein